MRRDQAGRGARPTLTLIIRPGTNPAITPTTRVAQAVAERQAAALARRAARVAAHRDAARHAMTATKTMIATLMADGAAVDAMMTSLALLMSGQRHCRQVSMRSQPSSKRRDAIRMIAGRHVGRARVVVPIVMMTTMVAMDHRALGPVIVAT
jgi:hypothetical protein